jgi:hypothetical protein
MNTTQISDAKSWIDFLLGLNKMDKKSLTASSDTIEVNGAHYVLSCSIDGKITIGDPANLMIGVSGIGDAPAGYSEEKILQLNAQAASVLKSHYAIETTALQAITPLLVTLEIPPPTDKELLDAAEKKAKSLEDQRRILAIKVQDFFEQYSALRVSYKEAMESNVALKRQLAEKEADYQRKLDQQATRLRTQGELIEKRDSQLSSLHGELGKAEADMPMPAPAGGNPFDPPSEEIDWRDSYLKLQQARGASVPLGKEYPPIPIGDARERLWRLKAMVPQALLDQMVKKFHEESNAWNSETSLSRVLEVARGAIPDAGFEQMMGAVYKI